MRYAIELTIRVNIARTLNHVKLLTHGDKVMQYTKVYMNVPEVYPDTFRHLDYTLSIALF